MLCGQVKVLLQKKAINAGQVLLAQKDVSLAPIHLRARAGLAYLPQEKSIFRRLTVRDNLRAVLELRVDFNEAQRTAKIDHLITTYELEHVQQSLGQHLSGGERRRLEIARCLVMDPKIVLLDEPFAGIDVQTEDQIISLLSELRSEGRVMLVSTHNLGSVAEFCDRTILIKGTVLNFGLTEEVFTSENLEKAFGGVLRHFSLGGRDLHEDGDSREVSIFSDDGETVPL